MRQPQYHLYVFIGSIGMHDIKRLVTERNTPIQITSYDRRLVFFGATNKISVQVKHNKTVYISFNVCRNYLWRNKSLKRYNLGYLDPIYPKILQYRNRFIRNNEISRLDAKKLWGLAKQAKMLNPKNWVFYQDPFNGNIYEVFPDSRPYNCWFTKDTIIF